MTDTGPPYPFPAAFGSNPIGDFAIGVSPIGGIVPAFNIWTTIISQYANSPALVGLITDFSEAIDQSENFNSFYDNIWNIVTANGLGLDIWGRIVGVNRVVSVQEARWFGFEEQLNTTDPFNVSPFYSGQNLTTNFKLSDQAYRTLILAKAASNITNGSAPSINAILRALFPGRGNAFVTDEGAMAMTYQFQFALSPVEQSIVKNSGVLPKSTGVGVTYFQLGVQF
jgi:hypothetical protein